MTDNEIIKALNGADGLEHISLYCADNNGEDVTSIKIVDIIDLINRQQAEIKNLQERNMVLRGAVDTQKIEIERLQSQLYLAQYTDTAKRNSVETLKEHFEEIADRPNEKGGAK